MSNLSSFERTEAMPPWAHEVEHSSRVVLVIKVILTLSGNMSAAERPDKPIDYQNICVSETTHI